MAEKNGEVDNLEKSQVSGDAAAAQPGEPENGPASPPAPPDDGVAVEAIAEGVEPVVDTPLDLAARTLAGDLRDAILELIRDQREPWHKLAAVGPNGEAAPP